MWEACKDDRLLRPLRKEEFRSEEWIKSLPKQRCPLVYPSSSSTVLHHWWVNVSTYEFLAPCIRQCQRNDRRGYVCFGWSRGRITSLESPQWKEGYLTWDRGEQLRPWNACTQRNRECVRKVCLRLLLAEILLPCALQNRINRLSGNILASDILDYFLCPSRW
jgi:hypothetical protein